ncbi:hypothetical protein MXB_5548, partial [Myxobolus squamalis]
TIRPVLDKFSFKNKNNDSAADNVLSNTFQNQQKIIPQKSYKKIFSAFSSESLKNTKASAFQFKIFGGNLNDIYNFFDENLPPSIQLLLETIEKNGLDVPGIYRISGNSEYITQCQSLIENHQPFLIPECDIFVQTSLVKSFFRNLQVKIIPSDILTNYSSCTNTLDRVNQLIEGIASLPHSNRFFLLRLLHHFDNVCSHSKLNFMDQRNISVVFGPTLIESDALDMCTAVDILQTLLFNQKLLFINDKFMKGITPIRIIVTMKVSSEEEMFHLKGKNKISLGYQSNPDLSKVVDWKQEQMATVEETSNSPTKPAEILRTCKISRGTGSRGTFKIIRSENNKFTLAPDFEKREEESSNIQ